jgi:purine-nucleoside phosphorylase
VAIGEARVGIVLGSGAGGLASRLERARRRPYGSIPGLVPAGVSGHAGELVTGELSGTPVAVLSGRPHFYEGHSMARIVAGVRALARSGIRAFILTNAAGGIRRSFSRGDLMLVSDHINAFGTNPLIGEGALSRAGSFVDMTHAYDAEFRRLARRAARGLGLRLREGVYVGTAGPCYETPAEIRLWRRLGADAIGMSTVPEVIALRRAGARVLADSIITNMAAGIGDGPLEHEGVLAEAKGVASQLGDLIAAVVPEIHDALGPAKPGRGVRSARRGARSGTARLERSTKPS